VGGSRGARGCELLTGKAAVKDWAAWGWAGPKNVQRKCWAASAEREIQREGGRSTQKIQEKKGNSGDGREFNLSGRTSLPLNSAKVISTRVLIPKRKAGEKKSAAEQKKNAKILRRGKQGMM